MNLVTICLSDVWRETEGAGEAPSVSAVLRMAVGAFVCSKSSYHVDFLRRKAPEHSERNVSRTYAIIDVDALDDAVRGVGGYANIIAAYFTIGISSIVFDSHDVVSKKLRGKLEGGLVKRDESVGCFVIGEICRNDGFDRASLSGELILDECLGIIMEVNAAIGGRFVLVDSRETLLESLYAKRGFRKLYTTDHHTADGVTLITSALKL